jgi:hypothetical protein
MSVTYLQVVKGSKSLNIPKGRILSMTSCEGMGAEYSHQARCRFVSGERQFALWARSSKHVLRDEFNLNNGDPTKTIRVRRMP